MRKWPNIIVHDGTWISPWLLDVRKELPTCCHESDKSLNRILYSDVETRTWYLWLWAYSSSWTSFSAFARVIFCCSIQLNINFMISSFQILFMSTTCWIAQLMYCQPRPSTRLHLFNFIQSWTFQVLFPLWIWDLHLHLHSYAGCVASSQNGILLMHKIS